MRDFFLQIVLFLAGVVSSIAIPLLHQRSQKFVAGMVAILLCGVALVWFGYEIGLRQGLSLTGGSASENNTTINSEPDKGAIAGQLRWNEEPISNINIILIEGQCGPNPLAITKTDEFGSFHFASLPPGEYFLGVNLISIMENQSQPFESNEDFVGGCRGPYEVKIGEIANVIVSIPKQDVSISKTILGETLTLSWQEYPDAAYYTVEVIHVDPKPATGVVSSSRTIFTNFDLSAKLNSGRYFIYITAYDTNGIEIGLGAEEYIVP